MRGRSVAHSRSSSVVVHFSPFLIVNDIFYIYYMLLKCIGVFSAVVGCLRGSGPRVDVSLLRPEVPSHDPSFVCWVLLVRLRPLPRGAPFPVRRTLRATAPPLVS